jgi:hypothetical protein
MSYLRYLCLFAYIRRFCMEMTYDSYKILFSYQRTITLPLNSTNNVDQRAHHVHHVI